PAANKPRAKISNLCQKDDTSSSGMNAANVAGRLPVLPLQKLIRPPADRNVNVKGGSRDCRRSGRGRTHTQAVASGIKLYLDVVDAVNKPNTLRKVSCRSRTLQPIAQLQNSLLSRC